MTEQTEDFRQRSAQIRAIRDRAVATLRELNDRPFHPSELLIHGAVLLMVLPIFNSIWDRFTQPTPQPIYSPLSVEILEIYR
jgi:hypothetical protein